MVFSDCCSVVKLLLPLTPLSIFVKWQEADLQRYRTQLISMGKIENAAGANLKPRRHKTFEESIKAFEVGHIYLLFKTFTDTKLQSRLLHIVTCCCCPPSACRPLKMSATSSLLGVQVLPEVLQQQARLDDPGAAARREIIRSVNYSWDYQA